MEPAPSSAPAIVVAALTAKGHASPAEISEWFVETFGTPLPVTEATIRQAVTRLEKSGRIRSVPDEHGVYAMPAAYAAEAQRRAEANRPRTDSPPGPAAEGAYLVGLRFAGRPSVAYDLNAGRWVQIGPTPMVDGDALAGSLLSSAVP